MDDARFDALTKTLGTAHSRRGLTRLLAGLSLGGLLTTLGVPEAAAALLIGGSTCTKGSQCKTGRCLRSDKCSCSQNLPRCKQPANPCKKARCDFATNRCETKPNLAKNGATCAEGKICQDGVCTPDPAGTCVRGPLIPGDICRTATCGQNDSCNCTNTVGGDAFCGEGDVGCLACTSNDDCVEFTTIPGSACVECGDVCDLTGGKGCVTPCSPP